ncbi:UDP-N-acetylmuramoyl-tripeptide--D-alanyl-D-alanine ligase [Corynebacterium epidermidicanis]|uniref:UDP-N-acetylmuramoyl-tripeptide--D-alanyl-D-alanine ligase n=1 Tax=Corynebacterium epidermidicanis TaxID=1050174 RepID=A0A0G3GSH3_9CORY|nr:UDP-N-acetylmuramoyl-tripeptide--D-alanyl-D-alanine ligase [Corynebacterium epidermidicanis]AKK03525.1 UDP-N-acetylmuramoyl-tripeptide--D-alanyl-D-alanine ligase [Corynebacterium epidermidicanis]
MIRLTLTEIAQAVDGQLIDGAVPEATVDSTVEFDSRKITPGALFVALPGQRVDGHDFVAGAIEQGAVAALVARSVGQPAVLVPPATPTEAQAQTYAFAHDATGATAAVLQAMSKLARYVVDKCTAAGLKVVGVTGSAGKTSTKDLLATTLRVAGETVAPPGSFNNEIGHPYTALRCTEDTEFLVAEMSARGIGHIAHLAEIAPPHIGVVLNVGSAHLGEFGSRANIAQAKGELVAALPAEGLAVLNADDDLVSAMADRTAARVVTFSTRRRADYYATNIRLDEVARASFVLHTPGEEVGHPVSLQVFGEHQVSNALAAAAVGVEAGLTPAQVAAAISSHRNASANRMDVQTRADGVTVINDSYNANPDSMRAGIAALSFTAHGRPEVKSWAVLGAMAELGDEAIAEHEALADVLVTMRIDNLVVVGSDVNSHALATAAERCGIDTMVADSADAAINIVDQGLGRGDVVLVKASNSAGLWRVAEGLLAPKG